MADVQTAAKPANSKTFTIAGWVLSGLFIAFMALDAGMKLARLPVVEQTGRQMGLPAGSGFGIGVMEAAILALYVFPRTSLLGAVFVAALMGGTAAIHWMHGDPWASFILFGPYLAVFAWGGLWLREPRLRNLMPWRN
jgi:hypothetical protein